MKVIISGPAVVIYRTTVVTDMHIDLIHMYEYVQLTHIVQLYYSQLHPSAQRIIYILND